MWSPTIRRMYLFVSPLILSKLLGSLDNLSLFVYQPPNPPISSAPLISHDSLVPISSPANLFGRDLFAKFNATIKCHKKGIFISQPSDKTRSFLFPPPWNSFWCKILWREWIFKDVQLVSGPHMQRKLDGYYMQSPYSLLGKGRNTFHR